MDVGKACRVNTDENLMIGIVFVPLQLLILCCSKCSSATTVGHTLGRGDRLQCRGHFLHDVKVE